MTGFAVVRGVNVCSRILTDGRGVIVATYASAYNLGVVHSNDWLPNI